MSWRVTLGVVALAVLLAGCAGKDQADIPLAAGENGALPSLPPIPYAVAVTGELPPELGSLLRQLATTSADGAPPATSRLAISQRGEADRAKLEQALRAQGYFDGTVAAAVREPGEVASQGIADQLERLASPPQAVLVFESHRPALPVRHARDRSPRIIRRGGKHRRPRIWAWWSGGPR